MSARRNLPRSFSASGLNVSFFGTACVWQYWQLLAGIPAFLASDNIFAVPNAVPAATPEVSNSAPTPIIVAQFIDRSLPVISLRHRRLLAVEGLQERYQV